MLTLCRCSGIADEDGLNSVKSFIPTYLDQLGLPPPSEKLKALAPFHSYRLRAP